MASLLLLQCPYHGWEYTGSGECVAMPSTTPCPGVRVESLACSEQDGFVWVFPGEEAAMPAELPALAQPPRGYVIHAEIEVRLGHPSWFLHQKLAVCTSKLASLPAPGCVSMHIAGPRDLQQLEIPCPSKVCLLAESCPCWKLMLVCQVCSCSPAQLACKCLATSAQPCVFAGQGKHGLLLAQRLLATKTFPLVLCAG